MYLRKRIGAVVLVLAVLAACIYGSTLEMTQPGENNINIRETLFGGARDKETIYFWYTDDSMTSFFNSAAVAFGENGKVRVIPVLVSESEYLEAINHASLHTDQIPDVFIISHDALEKAYLAGLASEIKDDRNLCSGDNFSAAALDAVTYHGRTVAYPLYFETSALVYNEIYLEEWARQQAIRELNVVDEDEEDETGEDAVEGTEGADETTQVDSEPDEVRVEELTAKYMAEAIPTTVDDLLNIADTYDAPEGVEVMKWDVSSITYNYWIVGNYMIVGGDSGDDEGNININNEETVQCLEVYEALNQFFSIESDTVTYDSVIQDFIDGKTMFTVGTTDVIKRLEEAKEDGSFAYEYGIATMPDVSEKLHSRSLSVTEAIAVNGYSEHKRLANSFAAYLATEGARSLYERTGKIPANLNTDADNGAVQIFKMEYAESISLPKMMSTGNFWLQLEVLFSKVWNGGNVPNLVQELADRIAAQTAEP